VPKRPSRDIILDRGLDLLSQVGLNGVTLGVLAAETGMSKSGLFAHFKSKIEIERALLRRMANVAQATVVSPAMKLDGLDRLRAVVTNWLGWTTRAGLSGGCPIAAALFELDDQDSEIRDEVMAMESRWREILAQLAQDAIARGELRADLDVDQFVWEICGIYLSHHASSRFLKDAASDSRAQIAFQALIQRATAPSAKTSS